MSFEVMARVTCRDVGVWNEMVKPIQDEYPGSGKNLKWTMMALSDYANKEGYCFPSVRSIEQWSGLSTRSVQRALKQAQVLQIVKVKRRFDMSSEYLIDIDRLPYIQTKRNPKQQGPHQQFFEDVDMFEEAGIDFGGVEQEPAPGATVAQTPRQTGTGLVPTSPEPPASVAPKPVIEPTTEPVTELVSAEQARHLRLSQRDFIKGNWDVLKELHPQISGVRKVTDAMLDNAKKRAKAHMNDGEDFFDVWQAAFEKIVESPFLLGQLAPGKGRTSRFKLSLSKMLKPHIFERTINGEYVGSDTDTFDPETGEVLGPARAATNQTVDRLRQIGERELC